jgi:hypothetical protein
MSVAAAVERGLIGHWVTFRGPGTADAERRPGLAWSSGVAAAPAASANL